MNPECQQNKHQNCDGLAVDEHDDLVGCSCTCHDVPEPARHATTCDLLVRHRDCTCGATAGAFVA